jgi:hypothetical protein
LNCAPWLWLWLWCGTGPVAEVGLVDLLINFYNFVAITGGTVAVIHVTAPKTNVNLFIFSRIESSTLKDLTAGTTEKFTDKNPYNQLSDTIVFDPTNEFHTGGTTVLQAPPSHVRYNIVSNDNKIILPDGNGRDA